MSHNQYVQVKFSTKAKCFEFLKYNIGFDNVDEYLTKMIEQEMSKSGETEKNVNGTKR